jgi:hypothetical protein
MFYFSHDFQLSYKVNKNSNGFSFSPDGSGTEVERTAGIRITEVPKLSLLSILKI